MVLRQDEGLRKSPYEPGVYFVNGQTWQVGERYELVKLLGSGSFSSVCLAVDRLRGMQVALKRIPDVLSSPEQAKRVLREVCILRRLRHPTVIALLDAFTRPSATGPCKLVGGKLVRASLDVYIAMEYCDGGDLFNHRGQLSADEVKLLMWQLCHGLKYLHGIDVWHRDLKSSNVLLTREGPLRIVKIADLGSARSANMEGYHFAEQKTPAQIGPKPLLAAGAGAPPGAIAAGPARDLPMHPSESADSLDRGEDGGVMPGDLYVRVGEARASTPSGFRAPLTRMVATPCYRAPEVVMSRGGYTSAIDMWSLGCIFGELLGRVARVGSATTPQLQVAPLFAIHGMPKTPCDGESFRGGPGCDTTRKELRALFDVTGTPSWADVDAVPAPPWRRYLQRLPGQAPTLHRRLGQAGEATIHLLSRMLAFDPSRRCSAEEALAHEYFAELEAGSSLDAPTGAGQLGEGQLTGRVQSMDLEPGDPDGKRTRSGDGAVISGLKEQLDNSMSQAAKRARSGSLQRTSVDLSPGPSPMAESAPDLHHYYNETDAARALAMLEEEMADITHTVPVDGLPGPDDDSTAKLRRLLEGECEAQAAASGLAASAARLGELCMQTEGGLSGPGSPRGGAPGNGAFGGSGVLAAWSSLSGRRGVSGMSFGAAIEEGISGSWDGLQEDETARLIDPAEFARRRMSHVADSVKGAALDPAQYLKADRHKEWAGSTGERPGVGPRGPRWGVSSGDEQAALDPALRAAIRRQQQR